MSAHHHHMQDLREVIEDMAREACLCEDSLDGVEGWRPEKESAADVK